jgi:hypothetical protein
MYPAFIDMKIKAGTRGLSERPTRSSDREKRVSAKALWRRDETQFLLPFSRLSAKPSPAHVKASSTVVSTSSCSLTARGFKQNVDPPLANELRLAIFPKDEARIADVVFERETAIDVAKQIWEHAGKGSAMPNE